MKWVMYGVGGLLALVLLAVIVLLAMGGGRGESTLGSTVEIARPASVVFRWVTEPARIKTWLGWLVEIRELGGTPQSVGGRAALAAVSRASARTSSVTWTTAPAWDSRATGPWVSR